MPIGTDSNGTDDNEGPHCRNCHSGASQCYVCHSDDSRYSSPGRVNVSSASTSTIGRVGNQANFAAQAFVRQSATVGAVGSACLDGGFTFPHRTLGKDMLKDELWGIGFDGVAVSAGATRTGNAALTANAAQISPYGAGGGQPAVFEYWTAEDKNANNLSAAVRTDSGAIQGAKAENLDSVCIDCHGDSTYWNGDNAAAFSTFKAQTTTTVGAYGWGPTEGWELLLKGLP